MSNPNPSPQTQFRPGASGNRYGLFFYGQNWHLFRKACGGLSPRIPTDDGITALDFLVAMAQSTQFDWRARKNAVRAIMNMLKPRPTGHMRKSLQRALYQGLPWKSREWANALAGAAGFVR